jgi:hypothetical protein
MNQTDVTPGKVGCSCWTGQTGQNVPPSNEE